MMLKAYKQCVEDCNTALSIDEGFTKARQRLVKALIQLGEFSKAKGRILLYQYCMIITSYHNNHLK